jgi:hypothetical protein
MKRDPHRLSETAQEKLLTLLGSYSRKDWKVLSRWNHRFLQEIACYGEPRQQDDDAW